MYRNLYIICLFALFMKVCCATMPLLYTKSNAPYDSHTTSDYTYIYNFLQTDTNIHEVSQLHTIQTQAYNTIRIIWENPCTLFDKEQDTPSIVVLSHCVSKTILYRQALHKARNILLKLEYFDTYRNDSGLQLALALSYFLENYMIRYDKIQLHMQKWEQRGHEIPKNLVKMTDYKDSIQTILFLCKISAKCNSLNDTFRQIDNIHIIE